MKKQDNEMITVGIETSCDETSVGVYSTQRGILANTLFSQIELHKKFGGVIPEIASRSQLEKINDVFSTALEKASCNMDDIDHIAVTNKPGLPGSLLVGLSFAKGVAWRNHKKLIGVNHLEGHTFSPFIEHNVPFPHLCLTASGGHTSLHLVRDFGSYTTIGETRDDAAGEAFDKVAKLLQLPYPGGPEIEKRAAKEQFHDYFMYPRYKSSNNYIDFSFSGLKTAVLYNLIDQNAYDLTQKKLTNHSDELKNHVASSLLVCIADIFAEKISIAIKQNPTVKAITFVGGVACNRYLRNRIAEVCTAHDRPFFYPSPQYCTDNGAMIAFVGSYQAKNGIFATWNLDIS